MKQILIVLVAITLFSCGNQNEVKMETLVKKEVGTVELVLFKAKHGFSKSEVIEAAKAVNPIVEKFDGFISRKLAVSEYGTWTDIVYWTDLESAEFAAQEVMKSETCQKFFGMIDENSMQLMHLRPVVDSK